MADQRAQVIYLHPAKQRVGFPFADMRLSYLTPFTLMPVGLIGLANLLAEEGVVVRGLNYPAECFIEPGFDLKAWLRAAVHLGSFWLISTGTNIASARWT